MYVYFKAPLRECRELKREGEHSSRRYFLVPAIRTRTEPPGSNEKRKNEKRKNEKQKTENEKRKTNYKKIFGKQRKKPKEVLIHSHN